MGGEEKKAFIHPALPRSAMDGSSRPFLLNLSHLQSSGCQYTHFKDRPCHLGQGSRTGAGLPEPLS